MRSVLWTDRVKCLGGVVAVVMLTIVAIEAPVFAGVPAPVPVPEISGASLSAGLGLLGAGLLWLRSRPRSK